MKFFFLVCWLIQRDLLASVKLTILTISHMLTKKSEDHEAAVTSGGGTLSIQYLKGTDSRWWKMIELTPSGWPQCHFTALCSFFIQRMVDNVVICLLQLLTSLTSNAGCVDPRQPRCWLPSHMQNSNCELCTAAPLLRAAFGEKELHPFVRSSCLTASFAQTCEAPEVP